MRKGNCVGTRSGNLFYIIDPHIDDVDVRDIAHALSNIGRFNGHSEFHYSVAHHSLLVAEELRIRRYDYLTQFWGLVHDCSEAYIADIPAPLKQYLPNYLKIESKIQDTIYDYFNVPKPTEEEYKPVAEVDSSIVHLEGLVYLKHPNWVKYNGDINVDVRPQPREIIRRRFLLEIEKLKYLINRWCDDA